jgi:tRNA (guanine-N7-)-methyltransferase
VGAHRSGRPLEAGDWLIRNERGKALRSFGRRKGHPLTDRQQKLVEHLLPQVRVALDRPFADPASSLFAPDVADLWLEIGFGGAEHLIESAERNPTIGLIGCEPFINGVVKALTQIETRRLKNIRLFDGDAREVLAWLPPASIGRAFMLFPDPWPKRKHHKRRLASPETIAQLARVIRPGGELRMATDIASYARAMRQRPRAVFSCWRNRPMIGASASRIGHKRATSSAPCVLGGVASTSASPGKCRPPRIRQFGPKRGSLGRTGNFPVARGLPAAYKFRAHDHLNFESGPSGVRSFSFSGQVSLAAKSPLG